LIDRCTTNIHCYTERTTNGILYFCLSLHKLFISGHCYCFLYIVVNYIVNILFEEWARTIGIPEYSALHLDVRQELSYVFYTPGYDAFPGSRLFYLMVLLFFPCDLGFVHLWCTMPVTKAITYYRTPLPSARQHPSNGDCLEVKREYYQNCSVLGCVTQCSQSAAHSYEQFLQV